MSPSRWPEVVTTKEEKLLFVALTIDPEKVWRSAEGLARELGWSAETVADMFASRTWASSSNPPRSFLVTGAG